MSIFLQRQARRSPFGFRRGIQFRVVQSGLKRCFQWFRSIRNFRQYSVDKKYKPNIARTPRLSRRIKYRARQQNHGDEI